MSDTRDVTCDDCGNDMMDVPLDLANDGLRCDVCGSVNTRALK